MRSVKCHFRSRTKSSSIRISWLSKKTRPRSSSKKSRNNRASCRVKCPISRKNSKVIKKSSSGPAPWWSLKRPMWNWKLSLRTGGLWKSFSRYASTSQSMATEGNSIHLEERMMSLLSKLSETLTRLIETQESWTLLKSSWKIVKRTHEEELMRLSEGPRSWKLTWKRSTLNIKYWVRRGIPIS